jgi:hypothetical protein
MLRRGVFYDAWRGGRQCESGVVVAETPGVAGGGRRGWVDDCFDGSVGR